MDNRLLELNLMHYLSYGLFVLTTRSRGIDNGCIINVASQITERPDTIAISVNKHNYTHELLTESGVFNLNILTEEAPMKVFSHFGFQSGRDVNKFAECDEELRATNGVLYLPKYLNGYLSGKLAHQVDMGTHSLFIAEVVESKICSEAPSVTYAYYQKHIKTTPKFDPAGTNRWACQVCGYVYEGEEVPDDFICPWCKHGKSDFIKS